MKIFIDVEDLKSSLENFGQDLLLNTDRDHLGEAELIMQGAEAMTQYLIQFADVKEERDKISQITKDFKERIKEATEHESSN